MTTFDAEKLKKEYLDWYNQTLEFSNLSNNVVRIDTPFKDNSLDNLIIYALYDQSRDMITLTDDGYNIFDLENNGISLNKSKKIKRHRQNEFIFIFILNDSKKEINEHNKNLLHENYISTIDYSELDKKIGLLI
ncbi:DUF1828 domain-containing protein [Staphylococcus aureus]|nr:DUF1828 domain-containing protein [Staphylococcus aureus]UXT29720.1 DUF1828 domain-containing protein [Staphylococcus aureus]UXU14679.1 DUF1828 domain-containing protein [Staphylococcus aureus]